MSDPANPLRSRVTGIRAPHGSPWFELDFADRFSGRIPNHILRGYCPCAGCQGHGTEIQFQAGRNADLRDIEEVGRYGLKLVWGDSHGDGIYTFAYLRHLAELVQQHAEALPEVHPVLPRAGH